MLTALPFTVGHEDLVRFAVHMAEEVPESSVKVMLVTQDHEPLIAEREWAVSRFISTLNQTTYTPVYPVMVNNSHSEDPESEGFWEYWTAIFKQSGWQAGDYIVGSEPYIKTLADLMNGEPMPYDIPRDMRKVSGTMIRDNPFKYWTSISEHLRFFLQKQYVLFGAESVGKTTLARRAADTLGGTFVPEFARPYLSLKYGNESKLTTQDMKNILLGQEALEFGMSVERLDTPHIWFDTDLLSTYGYYKLHPELLGSETLDSVFSTASTYTGNKHYFVVPSNIPFEEDPQRYGGDKRESDDQFWIDILEEFEVPYTVLSSSTVAGRMEQIGRMMHPWYKDLMTFKRKFNE
jgi:NadR type nicotinamide-nucleotide adenylyltransferase